MVNLSIAVDQATIAQLAQGLDMLSSLAADVQAKETRRMGLAICDSLRAARVCPIAPKRIRPREYRAEVSPNPPKYIMYRNGKKLATPLHRWRLTRKLGTPAQYSRDYYVYVHERANRRGKIVPDLATEKRELLEHHGGIQNRGLARKSWGWAKKMIYGSAPDTATWRASKHNRRNPIRDVSGFFRQFVTGPTKGVELEIANRLDYIGAIVPASEVDAAIRRGYSSWLYKFQNNVAGAQAA